MEPLSAACYKLVIFFSLGKTLQAGQFVNDNKAPILKTSSKYVVFFSAENLKCVSAVHIALLLLLKMSFRKYKFVNIKYV